MKIVLNENSKNDKLIAAIYSYWLSPLTKYYCYQHYIDTNNSEWNKYSSAEL